MTDPLRRTCSGGPQTRSGGGLRTLTTSHEVQACSVGGSYHQKVLDRNFETKTRLEITGSRLKVFSGKLSAEKSTEYARYLEEARERFHINTPRRVRHWMAQMAHESAGFTSLVESANYFPKNRTEAEGFANAVKNFKAFRKIENDEERLEKYRFLKDKYQTDRGEALFNFVYGSDGNDRKNRKDSNDGWDYRGRGFIQLTGRANYISAESRLHLGIDKNPDLVATPRIAALTSGDFWLSRGLNNLADLDNLRRITTKIKGSPETLSERRELYHYAVNFWPDYVSKFE